jgi:hypothetical protein
MSKKDDDVKVTVTKNSAEVLGVDVPGTTSFRVDSDDGKAYSVFDTKAEADQEAERRHDK